MPQCPTYNNASDALGGVAASLQVLGDDCEDTRGQSHVEETMSLRATTLELLEVLVKVLEGLVLIVLAGNVCAELAEVLKLLLDLLGGGLHVRLDAPQILLMVHLGAGISDDSDILGEELVTVLESCISYSDCVAQVAWDGIRGRCAHQSKERGVLCESISQLLLGGAEEGLGRRLQSSSWPNHQRLREQQ